MCRYLALFRTLSWYYFVSSSLVVGRNYSVIDLLFQRMAPPNGATVFEGATINVYCGSSSPVNWTFHHNYDIRPRNIGLPVSNRHIKGDKNITLVHLEVNDSGDYYCHGMANNEHFSIQIYIEVTRIVIVGIVIPNWVEAEEGSSATLHCGSVKRVMWNGVHLSSQNKTIRGNIITLYNLKKEHSGRYFCRGFDMEGIFQESAYVLVDAYVARIPEKNETYRTIHERVLNL